MLVLNHKDIYQQVLILNSLLQKIKNKINSLCLTREACNSPRLINLWSSDSRSNWNLEMLVFEERGRPEYPEKKLEYPEKNLLEQGQEPTTNSTHIMTPSPGIGNQCLFILFIYLSGNLYPGIGKAVRHAHMAHK